MKTVSSNFVENIIMEQPETCWAACIDMVVKEKNIQSIIVNKLRNLRTGDSNSTTMPSNKEYYSKLFEDSSFTNKGCNQYQSSTFPNQDFIISCIEKDNPIIFSGIFYPLLYGNDKTHAIVVHGYKTDDKTFWILALDPIRKNTTRKIAWVYNELIKFDYQKRITIGNKIDFVTDFNASSPKYINRDFNASILPSNHEYSTPDNLKKTIDLVNLIKDSKKQLIIKYFGVLKIESLDASQPTIPWIPKYNLAEFTQSNTSKRLFYYPIWGKDQIVKLEFIFYEDQENKLTLIGIQEPVLFYKIKKAQVKVNGEWVEININHVDKNYEVFIDSNDNVYFVIKSTDLGNQTYYIPVEDYKNSIGEVLIKGQGYNEIEIKNFNLEHSSINAMPPNFTHSDLINNGSLKNLDTSIQKKEILIDRKHI